MILRSCPCCFGCQLERNARKKTKMAPFIPFELDKWIKFQTSGNHAFSEQLTMLASCWNAFWIECLCVFVWSVRIHSVRTMALISFQVKSRWKENRRNDINWQKSVCACACVLSANSNHLTFQALNALFFTFNEKCVLLPFIIQSSLNHVSHSVYQVLSLINNLLVSDFLTRSTSFLDCKSQNSHPIPTSCLISELLFSDKWSGISATAKGNTFWEFDENTSIYIKQRANGVISIFPSFVDTLENFQLLHMLPFCTFGTAQQQTKTVLVPSHERFIRFHHKHN